MKFEVKIQSIVIKDERTGEEYTVRTLRTAKEIAGYIEETENEELTSRVQEMVADAMQQ